MITIMTDFSTLITLVIILGLIAGSFLNVVVYRLPMMLKLRYEQQARLFLNLDIPNSKSPAAFNLAWPRSHCPHCKKQLTFWQNIPLLSFLFLRGQCFYCRQSISLRYPLIELICTCFALLLFLQFGFTYFTLGLCILSFSLLALSVIDLQHKILPDEITLSILWLGLIFNAFHIYTSLFNALWGAIAGYSILWFINWVFKVIRKKEGMGHGDFKLLALLGAWFGWQFIPFIILLSSILGLITALTLLSLKKISKDTPIAFGPFLALTGFIIALWGPFFIQRFF